METEDPIVDLQMRLDAKIKEFEKLHRKAKYLKKNEIVPMQQELRDMIKRKIDSRKTNYNIVSD